MTFQNQIDATHPMNDDAPAGALEADSLAMTLVGERHDKRDLVDLVRWLLLRNVTDQLVVTTPGIEAHCAIQCTDGTTGKVGTFLFLGPSYRVPGVRCSPLCTDLAELFVWMKTNGWQFNGARSNYIKT